MALRTTIQGSGRWGRTHAEGPYALGEKFGFYSKCINNYCKVYVGESQDLTHVLTSRWRMNWGWGGKQDRKVESTVRR